MSTINDVAKEAGVSKATVSRILNKQGTFSDETIANVMSAVHKLDYHPNEVARALGKSRSNTIALILPTKDIPSFVEIQSSLEDAFYHKGYKVMLFSSLYDREKEEVTVKMLQNNMIDGIVLGSYTNDISHFTNCTLPVISVGRQAHDSIPYVKADDKGVGILAAKHLLGKNCKKLLYLTTHIMGISADERYAGFKSILTNSDVECWAYEISLEDQLRQDFSYIIHKMIIDHPDADGLFCETDMLAMSCIQNYSKLGYKIPENIKIIGYGDFFYSHLMNPALTTIRMDQAKFAEATANLLIDTIERREVASTQIEIPVTLIERQTT